MATGNLVSGGAAIACVLIFLNLQTMCLGQGCKDLKIKTKDTGEDVSSLCESWFNTTVCLPFVESFNRSDLPQEYPKDGPSVDAPAGINLVGLDTRNGRFMYPGLAISWESPLSDAGKMNCIGYLVIWTMQNGTQERDLCRLFKIDKNNKTAWKELMFTADIPFVKKLTDFKVKVFSMHAPRPDQRDDERLSVEMNYKSSQPYVFNEDPGKWAPSLSYKTQASGTLDIAFTRSPPAFNLTEFDVMLVKKDDPNNAYLTKNVIAEPRTDSESQVSVQFTNLASDTYKIMIWVRDQFHNIVGQCQCWGWEGLERKCNNICGAVSTHWFNMTVTAEPGKPTPNSGTDETTGAVSSSSARTGTSAEAVPSSSDSTNSIIGAVIGSIVFLAVLFILICCYYRNKHKVKTLLRQWRHNDSQYAVPTPEQDNPQPSSPVVSLKKKTVYILSSEDHKCHSYATECFANFLEVHCLCDVIYPPHSDIHKSGPPFQWFIANIGRADHIIFVDSKGAETLTQAHLHHQTYKSRRLGPEGDMFDIGLKHILAYQEAREAAVLVSFGGKYCGKFIQATTTYELPNHLTQLLEKIHGLKGKMSRTYNTCLPLQVENISQLSEGQQLLQAIADAKSFEEKNPNWVAESFGRPTPIYQHQPVSMESGIGSLPDRSLSVSNQNLSDAGSPVSMIEQPGFSPSSFGPPAMQYENVICPAENHVGQYSENQGRDCLSSAVPSDCRSCYTIATDVPNEPSGIRDQPSQAQNKKDINPEIYTIPVPEQNAFNLFVPPESASLFTCTNFSDVMRNINQHTAERNSCPAQSEQSSYLCMLPSNQEEFKQSIRSPDSLSDIQFDSISSALRDVNADTNNMWLKLECVNETELSDPDVVSI